ncbi:MAG: thiamine-phosphate kinase [Myxococcota bacterium]|nr:thiamine-phosphate kinase [Myxococcota bacterium]
MTTLAELGEFDLIARIKARASRLHSRDVVVGIGDDAAVLRPRANEDLVVSTDALVEDVHFRWDNQSPASLGRRALLANLSDLAAMGARPVGFTLALSAPTSLTLTRIDGMLGGLLREAKAYGCPLIGGNLSRAKQTTMAITVLGAVQRGRALRRDTAQPGDAIYVTGTLGGAGLALRKSSDSGSALRHLPKARVVAGRALARLKNAGACIDISDGFVSDLGHVLKASGVGAEVDLARIPTPRAFARGCERLGLDANNIALRAGEDYELLFTLRSLNGVRRQSEAALSKRLGVQVTEVGRVEKALGLRGLGASSSAGGFRHF